MENAPGRNWEVPGHKRYQKTMSIEKNGKWHFITTEDEKEDATIFIGTFLPKLYKKLATHDLESLLFDNFPVPRRGGW